VIGAESGIDSPQVNERVDQQRGADHQHERHRDLGDDETIAQPHTAAIVS
jgi:hypothetical protein